MFRYEYVLAKNYQRRAKLSAKGERWETSRPKQKQNHTIIGYLEEYAEQLQLAALGAVPTTAFLLWVASPK